MSLKYYNAKIYENSNDKTFLIMLDCLLRLKFSAMPRTENMQGSVNCVLFCFKFLPHSLHSLDPWTADFKFIKHTVICTNYKNCYLTTQ